MMSIVVERAYDGRFVAGLRRYDGCFVAEICGATAAEVRDKANEPAERIIADGLEVATLAMALILRRHAELRMHQHGIALAWVDLTIHQPAHVEPCPRDPSLRGAWRRIPQRGNRVLRVVWRPAGGNAVVVSVFFDRGAQRWLP